MRIALISPKGPLYRHRGGIFKRSLRYAPLTLVTLAALGPDELAIEWTLIDEGIEPVPDDLDADLVAMTVITGTAVRAYELADSFRRRGLPVVLGGPHVTLVPDDAAPHADSIVVGYAEDAWPQLLRDFAAGRLRRRYDQAEDLSLAGRPRPRRYLHPPGRYLTTNTFEATRACVHKCDFCVVPSAWGRRPLQKPVGEVVDDIRRTGARKALFLDLNLVADRRYAAELFTALEPLRIKWYGLATTLLADDEPLLDLAARSGCKGVLMGLESICADSLRDAGKGFNAPSDYPALVQRLHDAGIGLQGCFCFGMDHDTPDVFDRTAELAIDAKIDLPRFAIVTPFPGTALHRRLESEGRIRTRNWELYDGQHVVFEPAAMSAKQLMDGTRRAWRRAYSWAAIARRLWKTPSGLGITLAANLGYRYYGRRLDRYYTCDWFLEPDAVAPAAAVG